MTAETAAPTLRPALTQSAILGEGLQWHAPSGRWWWTDIEGGCIHAWTPGAAATLVLRLPERVGCFVHARSGALLLGMAKRLARLALPDLQACGEFEAAPQELVPVEAGLPTTRVNDGRCDRSGNLVSARWTRPARARRLAASTNTPRPTACVAWPWTASPSPTASASASTAAACTTATR
jgi:sugar lactone lactonase YvrE